MTPTHYIKLAAHTVRKTENMSTDINSPRFFIPSDHNDAFNIDLNNGTDDFLPCSKINRRGWWPRSIILTELKSRTKEAPLILKNLIVKFMKFYIDVLLRETQYLKSVDAISKIRAVGFFKKYDYDPKVLIIFYILWQWMKFCNRAKIQTRNFDWF